MRSDLYTKKTITPNERLQLIGLMTVAQDLYKRTTDCEAAMEKIVGYKEKNHGSHFGDAIYGNETVDQVLETLEIKVSKK